MADVLKKWTVFCPLIAELRDPAMRVRHWTQLMMLMGKAVAVSPTILLRDMWNMELHKNPDAVEETADQAKQEAKMEKLLAKLNENWSVVEFAFDSHKGTEIFSKAWKLSRTKAQKLSRIKARLQCVSSVCCSCSCCSLKSFYPHLDVGGVIYCARFSLLLSALAAVWWPASYCGYSSTTITTNISSASASSPVSFLFAC